jgi:CheY-like chemotaxis protein
MVAAHTAWTTDSEQSVPHAEETLHDSGTIDILVADDEMIVRRLLEMVLRPSGIRLESVSSGTEAIRIFEEHHADVRLVLLDIQMPGLDGPETFRRLKAINPDVRVLFMSGDPGGHSTTELIEMGALGLIEKPFGDLMMVASRLRQIAAAGNAHTKCHR